MITNHYFTAETLNNRPGICACGGHKDQHDPNPLEIIRNSVTRERYNGRMLSDYIVLNFGPGRIVNIPVDQAAALADEIQKLVALKR